MTILASGLAIDLILALTQRRDGARLAELSVATGAPLSSAQRAVRLLLADGVVEQRGARRPRYRLRMAHPALSAVLQLAIASLPRERVMTVFARSNPAIEFAAVDREGYVTVTSPVADPRDVLAFDDAVARLSAVAGTVVIRGLAHHDAVASARRDPDLRSRIERATTLKGTLARSFPVDRRIARARTARAHRRRPTHSLSQPSGRALAAVARRHGLRRIRLFGSAARGDLGPASDVDVLVEPSVSSQLSLADLARLESDLEELFERHVDLATPGGLRDDVRAAVDREGVTIHGRP